MAMTGMPLMSERTISSRSHRSYIAIQRLKETFDRTDGTDFVVILGDLQFGGGSSGVTTIL